MSQKASVIFAGCLAILSVTPCMLGMPEGDRVKELSMECRKESPLRQEELEDLRLMKYLETTDQKIKCFIKCMLTGLNLMSEEGELTVEGVSGNMEKYKKHFPACKNVTGTDFCDKALNFHNCVWKQTSSEDQSTY